MRDEGPEIVIRPSSASIWNDCPRRQAARVFKHLVEDAGYQLATRTFKHIGAAIGTAVHAGAESLNRARMAESRPDVDEAIDRALLSFGEEMVTDEILWDQMSPHPGTAQKQIDKMVRRYRSDVLKTDMKPLAVEQRLEGKINSRVIVSGKLDSLVMYPYTLADVKTGTRRRNNASQYGLYSPLARANGFQVEKIVEEYVPRVQVNAEQPPLQRVEIDPAYAEDAALRTVEIIVAQVDAFMQTGDPASFPSNPNSALCSNKFCPAHGTKFCKDWI